jgi:hypothetical protein
MLTYASTGYVSTQFGYGADFKNQWALHRKHCDENYQCPPSENSGIVAASTEASACTCRQVFLSTARMLTYADVC